MDIDYKAFETWVMAKPGRRSCQIDIGQPFDNQKVRIWVYDYDLSIGQHVTTVDEIDLEAARRKRVEDLLAKLRTA